MGDVACQSCGNMVRDTAKFCPRCGNQVSVWTPPSAVEQQPFQQQQPYPQQSYQQPYEQPFQQQPYQRPYRQQPYQQTNYVKKIIGGILIFFGFICVAYGINELNSFSSQLLRLVGYSNTGAYVKIVFGLIAGIAGLVLLIYKKRPS